MRLPWGTNGQLTPKPSSPFGAEDQASLHINRSISGRLVVDMAAAFPKFWLVTWIPTVSAAVGCSGALRVFARSFLYRKIGSTIKLATSAVLCSAISGASFELGYQITLIIHSEPSIAEGSAQSIALANYQSELPPGHHFALLFGGLPLAMLIGAILGIWLSWRSISVNASLNSTTTFKGKQ